MRGVRGHHLFCMALFTGHGYSEAFTQNMGAIVRSLKAGEAFRLVQGQDIVCAACPHLMPGGGCAHGTEDVGQRDAAACRVLGLSPGEEGLGWQQVREKLLGAGEEGFRAVCGGCRWAGEGLCSWALLQGQLL